PEHPGTMYGVNYGYVPGTMAADGEPVDAYVLGTSEPGEQCRGRVVAIIHRRDDIEGKLVVAVGGQWDEQSVAAAVAFQEQWFDSWVEMSGAFAGEPP
ncbi:MAG: inorganic diphosphatase, partial [Dehalococcoidia bacterium]